MEEEIKAIKKNDTWELSNSPNGHEAIGVKWNAKGEVERYKERLVAKGYKQQHGVDYDEVFAPIARMETIRLLISIAAQMGWRIFQLDVKSAFLNGYLEEIVYVEQPMGFAIKGQEEKVLKLKKALYGLKQAPRVWNSRIDKYFQDNRFVHCQHKYALYVKIFDNDFKKVMSYEFEITNIGLISYYLGLEVKQMNNGIFVSQESYAKKVLEKFKSFGWNPVNTPMKVDFGLFYSSSNEFKLMGFYDSDFVGDVDDRKMIMLLLETLKDKSLLHFLLVNLSMWLQFLCTCQAIWLKRLLNEFNMNQEKSTKIHIDNKFA
ncbi:hypothetical protein CR513_17616, partial [Mucuna pruriens]